MNMFRITKMITTGDLGEFIQLINSTGGSFIERETRVDEEHWLMCIACDDRNQAAVIRCWTSRAGGFR